MHILAFHFAHGQAADMAVRQLRSELDGAAHDVRTADVVVDGVEGVVLGLTVGPETRRDVMELAIASGGRLVADVPEEWTDKRRE